MMYRDVPARRWSLVASKPFEQVVDALTASIGRPDIKAFREALRAAANAAELSDVVQQAVGPSGLMEFARFDAGEVLRKERGLAEVKLLRLLVGNPLLMKEMARSVPDAASYAPVTILVDQRPDGVHLSYDSMASLVAPYGSKAALVEARALDARIRHLLETAAHVAPQG
jgi:hypothetical protein